jgi:ketol-acid reductoisomerase
MAKIYYEKDAELKILRDRTVAVIGYGIQGRGQALCLRDSGCRVVVGQRPGTENYRLARQDGFRPVPASDAARKADIIQILTQDHLQAGVYREAILPWLRPGRALCFSHGFNIHFRQIVPPGYVDVFMVAPKGPGGLVRRMFDEGKGVPCLFAVHQDASGQARALALAYCRAIGGTRAGVIETTFREETETDLFGEQSVLCGGVSELIKAGFETLTRAGYQPEIAYFEVLHELKLITDLIQETGIRGMRRRVSDTACYGDVTRGKRVISRHARRSMARILKEIQSGKFAREWMRENRDGRKNFRRLLDREDRHPIESVGDRLRKMMAWMD